MEWSGWSGVEWLEILTTVSVCFAECGQRWAGRCVDTCERFSADIDDYDMICSALGCYVRV